MTVTALMICTAIALPVAGLVGWGWLAVRRFDQEFRAGFEGIHFEL